MFTITQPLFLQELSITLSTPENLRHAKIGAPTLVLKCLPIPKNLPPLLQEEYVVESVSTNPLHGMRHTGHVGGG